ncbi:MAG: type V CRISPR-associated protein Cas12a/Cpf1 [Ignavibacteria bacterium]|nr:type V CRISPR-associated protein Cas12a/Cpf1 [Ignavibacteria bacterium]
MEQFTNLYQLSKTLRFELVPVGRTLEHIEKKGILDEDEERALDYTKVKKIIDGYHKDFIDMALRNARLIGLNEYETLYRKSARNEDEAERFEEIKNDLRTQITECFSKNSDNDIQQRWKNIFGKELIKLDLKKWADDNMDFLLEKLKDYFTDKNTLLKTIEEFDNFTTYFTGFHENRKNMYSKEEKSTAIAFRLINQNLPKFLDNIMIYEKAKEAGIDFSAVSTEMEEILKGITLDEIFKVEFYNKLLTQRGIDLFNYVVGGKAEEGGKKVKGLNEYINLHNQRNNDRNNRIPRLKQLYKQILSDRTSISFIPEKYIDDNELLESIENFYTSELINHKKGDNTINIISEIKNLLQNITEYNTNGIYVNNGVMLTNISQKIFGNWGYIHNALRNYYDVIHNETNSESVKSSKKYEKEKERWMKQKQFSVKLISEAINEYDKQSDNYNKITEYFKNLGRMSVVTEDGVREEIPSLIDGIYNKYNEVRDLLNVEYPEDKNLIQDKVSVALIKNFLDSVLELLHFIKALKLREEVSNKDENFYGWFDELYDILDEVIPLYNKVRNYLTQKPYSTEKFKLNFENSTLLAGWDLNKEADNTCVLLRKKINGDYLYYLGIMDKSHNRIFRDIPELKKGEECYEKMIYKLLPGPNKMLPKVFFSKSRVDEFKPSEEIMRNYEMETHKKGKKFNLEHCHKLIDFFKESISRHEDWKNFNFKFSPTSSYQDMSDFYREVAEQGYKINFQEIPSAFINELVDEGKLYLFQIYNKDFSPHSKGKPNLHTIYWKVLFDERNLNDVVFKLNGEAEVFYRRKSIQESEKIIHPANQPIENKNPDNPKKQSMFDYALIKDRRYTLDKFQFHVPITINFKARGGDNINSLVNEYLKNNEDVKIIGVDRGERHLLYLVMINQKGEILKQMSLNEIIIEYQNINLRTDYRRLLDEKEKQRDRARRDWGTVENIKELKEGYLSQIIHVISKLIVQNNCILVMEDLNIGFKRGRQKVEKQVYQKFEKMLIEKLNYLVFKNSDWDETGGALRGLQLTSKFDSFKKLGKQSGFVFYVPASYTSRIDPVSGFINFLYPNYESIERSEKYLQKFDSIRFNPDKEWFEFTFDYDNFTDRMSGSKTKWTVCTTNEKRYYWNKTLNNNKGGQQEVDVTEELKKLFAESDIVYATGENLIDKICEQNTADFFRRLLKLLSITVAMRYNNGKTGLDEEDYILSPVEPFFDSRKADDKLPQNADANGAYHIALKGLLLLNRLNEKGPEEFEKTKKSKDGKSQWLPHSEWLEFVQK